MWPLQVYQRIAGKTIPFSTASKLCSFNMIQLKISYLNVTIAFNWLEYIVL
jgi:hypothetical protein